MNRGILARLKAVVACGLAVAICSQVALAVEWEVSKSKKAVHIGGDNYQVSLTLPAADYQQKADVVFVLDKSTSGNIDAAKKAAQQMVRDLLKEKPTIDLKVGVIVFNRDVTINLELTKLTADSLETICTAIDTGASGGSNPHGGLLTAETMLALDTEVLDSNKYVVYVTDGIGYVWGEKGKPTSSYYQSGDLNTGNCSTSSLEVRMASGYTEPSFLDIYNNEDDFLASAIYDQPYVHGENSNNYIPKDKLKDVMSSVEKSIYLSAHQYATLASKYHCITLWHTPYGLEKPEYRLANGFMNWTETKGKSYCLDDDVENELINAFAQLKDELIYLFGFGKVEDVIGTAFDLVPGSITVTFNGTTLASKDLGNNVLGFGSAQQIADEQYPYMVTYVKEDASKETLTWDIYTPVEKENPVALSYSLKLNKVTTPGNYEVPTNEVATLEYYSSNEEHQGTEEFEQPFVEYTVESSKDDDDDDTPSTPPTKDVINQNPKTGVAEINSNLLFAITVLCLILCGGLLIITRKKQD